jgi:methionyl-tRNA formyltransferase
MNVVFFGTPQFAVPTLERLLSDPNFKVLGVVTQPDKRRGRGNQMTPSPVKALALQHTLPIWQPKRVKTDAESLEFLGNCGADVFVVIAYGQILSQAILDMPRLGCVNVHGSPLPKYQGAAPIQWSLHNGELETGITTMLMDAGMDTGPMLLEVKNPIALLDNVTDLATRLSQQGADLLVETLLNLETLQPRPQLDDEATYAPLLKKENFALDWSRPAIALHNQVRGFYPNCFAQFRGETIKVLATAPLGPAYWSQLPPAIQSLQAIWEKLRESGNPGEVLHIERGSGPIIQTGESVLLLQEVQLPGKRSVSGWDFANGTRLELGETLGNGEFEL